MILERNYRNFTLHPLKTTVTNPIQSNHSKIQQPWLWIHRSNSNEYWRGLVPFIKPNKHSHKPNGRTNNLVYITTSHLHVIVAFVIVKPCKSIFYFLIRKCNYTKGGTLKLWWKSMPTFRGEELFDWIWIYPQNADNLVVLILHMDPLIRFQHTYSLWEMCESSMFTWMWWYKNMMEISNMHLFIFSSYNDR